MTTTTTTTTTTITTTELCPFCAFFGVEVQPVSSDYFGEPATIGDIPACEDCALVADITETAGGMLDWLQEIQEAAQ